MSNQVLKAASCIFTSLCGKQQKSASTGDRELAGAFGCFRGTKKLLLLLTGWALLMCSGLNLSVRSKHPLNADYLKAQEGRCESRVWLLSVQRSTDHGSQVASLDYLALSQQEISHYCWRTRPCPPVLSFLFLGLGALYSVLLQSSECPRHVVAYGMCLVAFQAFLPCLQMMWLSAMLMGTAQPGKGG